MPMTSGSQGREQRVPILHQSSRMDLDDQKSTCVVAFNAGSKNSTELSCFLILASYYCDIPERKEATWI